MKRVCTANVSLLLLYCVNNSEPRNTTSCCLLSAPCFTSMVLAAFVWRCIKLSVKLPREKKGRIMFSASMRARSPAHSQPAASLQTHASRVLHPYGFIKNVAVLIMVAVLITLLSFHSCSDLSEIISKKRDSVL